MPAPYATPEQVTAALSEAELRLIADHDGDQEIDEDQLLAVILRASSIADTVLGKFAPFNAVLLAAVQTWVIHIASHYMRAERNMGTDDSLFLYEEALRQMEAMRDADEDDVIIPPADPTAGDPEAFSEYDQLWARDYARRVL